MFKLKHPQLHLLQQYDFIVVNWPASSPDISSTENIWHIMKWQKDPGLLNSRKLITDKNGITRRQLLLHVYNNFVFKLKGIIKLHRPNCKLLLDRVSCCAVLSCATGEVHACMPEAAVAVLLSGSHGLDVSETHWGNFFHFGPNLQLHLLVFHVQGLRS